MTIEEIIIVIFRTLGAFPVLINPFWGALLVIIIDFSDLFLMNYLDLGGVSNYQLLDKFLDFIYMMTFLLVLFRFNTQVKKIGIILFSYRIIGMILFEIFHKRWILFLFPNFFEFWIIVIAFFRLYKNDLQITKKNVGFIIIPIMSIKLLQEYVLHVNKILDNYTLIEVIEKITL
ncbi:MAG: hypothetical protein FI695_02325 [SAR202 cluster bacterium]|nr:hypothetical protein [Chloroflexota bacterium]MQG50800.1 hypothetical protein [SAR202 cluster bacterium]|tara:strand:+ start:10992 stop:11516 length:525 start_codon:yes stop_codon:yes gene_type:complete